MSNGRGRAAVPLLASHALANQSRRRTRPPGKRFDDVGRGIGVSTRERAGQNYCAEPGEASQDQAGAGIDPKGGGELTVYSSSLSEVLGDPPSAPTLSHFHPPRTVLPAHKLR